jgi:hypothetical protein
VQSFQPPTAIDTATDGPARSIISALRRIRVNGDPMTIFSRDQGFAELWDRTRGSGPQFTAAAVADRPDAARRYLSHAVTPGTPLASAVRLQMHGEIKLGKWRPFLAEEVIAWDHGFVWRARVKLAGLPVTGSDRWIDGRGSMRWKLLGLLPMMTAAGPDISRSALGRVQLEAVWLPSALCAPTVEWCEKDATHVDATPSFRGEPARISLEIDQGGAVQTIHGQRWGDPDKHGYRQVAFGGVVAQERSFGGYTIPSQLRLGWYFGSDRFNDEGEFFRVTVTSAEYR